MDKEALRSELESQGISGAKILRCLKLLRRIYTGHHIRPKEGVLKRDFKDFEEELELLKGQEMLKDNTWYSHSLIQLTEKGSSIGSDLVEESLEEKGAKISKKFGYTGRIIPFLIYDYLSTDLSFSKHRTNRFDWIEPLIEDDRVWDARNDLFETLEDLGLCTVVRHYVSTNNGEFREERYVISPEVGGYLQSEEVWDGYRSGLSDEQKNRCRAYRFLLQAPNFLDANEVEESREKIWEGLDEAGFDEEWLEDLINKLSEDGATTPYRGLMSDDLPFQIESESKYQIALKRRLVNPILAEFFEEPSTAPSEDQEVEELRNGVFPNREIEVLEILAEKDHSVFSNTGHHIREQLEKAVELYEDEHWSDCLSRIDNVCEDLVRELAIVRGEEFPSDNPLNQTYGGRLGALSSASFVKDPEEEYNSKFRSLNHDLESIHTDRNLSDAPHGGESIVITEGDVRRNIHLLVDIYFKIEELLR
jgi:hypothetical protein